MSLRPESGRLPAAYLTPGSSSFTEFVGVHAPELLPGRRVLPPGVLEAPHGTTIVAVAFEGGVLMAGDRRATMGNVIANRDMEKVFDTDEFSLVGIAGTAGLAVELVRLFQVELEHYEKIEGTLMSLEGKANRLATMIRGNLPMAMQGLAVVPMFCGFDTDTQVGRIFSYDVTGGCYEEHSHHCVGSGSRGSSPRPSRRTRSPLRSAHCTTRPMTTRPPADPTWVVGFGPPWASWMSMAHASSTMSSWPPRWMRSSTTAEATREVPDDRGNAVLRLARAVDEGPGGLR